MLIIRELRARGLLWREIAERLGYSDENVPQTLHERIAKWERRTGITAEGAVGRYR